MREEALKPARKSKQIKLTKATDLRLKTQDISHVLRPYQWLSLTRLLAGLDQLYGIDGRKVADLSGRYR